MPDTKALPVDELEALNAARLTADIAARALADAVIDGQHPAAFDVADYRQARMVERAAAAAYRQARDA